MNISIVVSNNTNTPYFPCLLQLSCTKYKTNKSSILWCDHFRVPLFLTGFSVDLLWRDEPGLTGFSPGESVNWDQLNISSVIQHGQYLQTRERLLLYLPLSLQKHPPVLSSAVHTWASDYTPAPADCFPLTANVPEALALTLWCCNETVLNMPCFN